MKFDVLSMEEAKELAQGLQNSNIKEVSQLAKAFLELQEMHEANLELLLESAEDNLRSGAW